MLPEVRTPCRPSDDPLSRLERTGFCILRGAVPSAEASFLDVELQEVFERTPFCEGDFYGHRTKRFGRLLARSGRVAAFATHPVVMDLAEAVLGPHCDMLQLNLTQAIALHPGAPQQFPHRDQDMWRGEIGRVEYLVNVMWPFTEYTARNGATLLWPGSHGPAALDSGTPADAVTAELAPGDALVFLGSTLHGAGANVSGAVRRGMIISYCLGWLKPYENQWLAYPPSVARNFPRELAALVGYRQHRPNLGNFEGRCPSILLGDEVPDVIGAIDALRPDQAATLQSFVAEQRTRA